MFVATFFLLFSFPTRIICSLDTNNTKNRSFIIDYDRDAFLKDDKPYRFISGSMHYFRVPREYWEDRIKKMKWAGLNAIETYVPWNIHEPWPGKFMFSDRADLIEFIKIVQKYDLDLILRMGPYICAEIDNGGLPWWLLKIYPNLIMRSSDPRFLFYVSKWYFKLFPMLMPFLYKNGGPVVMMQVENEFGSLFKCDREYMEYLRDLFRSYVGEDFLLFTVDGGTLKYLLCGHTPGLYPTVDFGTSESVNNSFHAQRVYTPEGGPLVNMEFYPGWLDRWGLNHSIVNTNGILKQMSSMYSIGASFNMYMFHGGTSFGYTSGAVYNRPCVTSYDYDAPLSEAGDPTQKYYRIRKHIEHLTGIKNPHPLPKPGPKMDYGPVQVSLFGSIFDLLPLWHNFTVPTKYPLRFEDIDFPYGFVLYQTVVPDFIPFLEESANLTVEGIRDRGYVMINGKPQGILSNHDSIYWLPVNVSSQTKIQIIVENNGRQTRGLADPKGIIGNVTLNNYLLINWTMCPIVMEDLVDKFTSDSLPNINLNSSYNSDIFVPSFYIGKFNLTGHNLSDTFLNMENWGKGHVFINNFNLGRYWPSLGPQVTLYVPQPILKQNINYILLFELVKPDKSISLISSPILDKLVKK